MSRICAAPDDHSEGKGDKYEEKRDRPWQSADSHTRAGVLATKSTSIYLDDLKNYLITGAGSELNLPSGPKAECDQGEKILTFWRLETRMQFPQGILCWGTGMRNNQLVGFLPAFHLERQLCKGRNL